ncbi:hypothetical protein H072_8825 [Dactylellina haptotyla CBS 200.50]|uniref:O-methylsterigmatocystin oxidoreductase n=1 Tax=Dactylellina haptotyla (strain CBS 200.50) TaxID=1284197 RepID=S8BE25_DACHA|nr:hypothetical protein H072_8825 [Dactylellina haptotyla CBS 200.50]
MLMLLLSPWAALALIGYLAYSYFVQIRRQRRLPPGPKQLPILGNIRDFPPAGEPEFQHWLKHKDLYGPISSVTVMGMTLVIIHDKQAVHEILEKNASKTSGRPTMVFANQLCGYGSIVLCQGYNSTFRHCRKLLHRELGTKVSAAQFQNAQESEVNRQLVRALNEPEKWLHHFQTTASATVLKMAYGYTIEQDKPDALVTLIEEMMTEFSLAAAPMAWIVDIIPALQHLPENFPGATFKKTARQWRKSIEAAAYTPYRFVQQQMSRGTEKESYVSRLVGQYRAESNTNGDLSREDENAIIWTAASLYGAAADTSVITLTAFTLAMATFPQVQQKAQGEIDLVVGTDRLPSIEDREKLPYVDALVKEAFRWWPVAPMGFPHTADDDVEYKGYHIPRGSLLLPAAWWLLRDPAVYRNPNAFDPDRFLSPRNEPDPVSDAFGYGRRICPGRFFADTSVYLNIVKSLAVFNINKMLDKDGNEVDIDIKVKPGILSYVPEFPFRVTPRSRKHIKLIRQIESDSLPEESDAQLIESITDYGSK